MHKRCGRDWVFTRRYAFSYWSLWGGCYQFSRHPTWRYA